MKLKSYRKQFRLIWIISGMMFFFWLIYSYQAHGVNDHLLKDSQAVRVKENDHYYSFSPVRKFQNVMIFFPGSLVDPLAYVPLSREISEHTVQVYLMKMPWRMASRGYNQLIELQLLNDRTKSYTLVGHSQGGKMAAQFVYENPDLVQKLILIGTTHPRDISLVDSKVSILKIYGSQDGVADEKSIIKNRPKLPSSAQLIRLEGANHSQFGYYGFQFGDKKSTISREKQHVQTIKHMLQFLKN